MMVVCYLILGSDYFTPHYFGTATVLAFLIGTFSWVTHIYAANLLRDTIPNYNKTTKRILIQIPIYVVLTQLGIGLATFCVMHIFGLIHIVDFWSAYRPVFIACLLLNVIATSFHEGLILFDKWKKSLIEAEQLKKLHLQSQLDSLKNQVNPHFLFNSLNCLSSLISTDADRASSFLDEMSKVYRYLLRSNENELATLESELQFITSYFHLIKTRYGEGIALRIKIDPADLNSLVAPLTLQLLVENAVKHNSILKKSPLQIEINSAAAGYLTVTNNIQLKTSHVFSNKIGLKNIVSKYKLMNQPEIIIQQTTENFMVRIPLIKNAS